MNESRWALVAFLSMTITVILFVLAVVAGWGWLGGVLPFGLFTIFSFIMADAPVEDYR